MNDSVIKVIRGGCLRKKDFHKLRIALPLLVISPYLVGFAPPDEGGTFVSVSGGKGVYPSGSCGQSFRHEYREAAVSVDHRIPMGGRGNYVTIGAFGEAGSDQKTLVHDDEGGAVGTTTTGVISTLGAHMGLDWKWFGIDLGAQALRLPDFDNSTSMFSRASLRIGPPGFYVSSSFLEGHPLLSDGAMLNVGAGTHFGSTQVWAGSGIGPQGLAVGILRARFDFSPIALGLTLQGNPNSRSRYSPGLANDYGMSAGLEFRLP
jgi:hypothetical protein